MKIFGWRRRFLASTRGKILGLLRAKSYNVNELAKALELTDNAVRSHLASLERDGLIQQLGWLPGFRRPHALYGLTAEAESLFPTAYGPLLCHFIAVVEKRLSSRELKASLREVGQMVGLEHLDQVQGKTRNQRIEVALAALKALGGDVKIQEREGKRFIDGSGCPISAATAYHPEACLIVEALLSEIIGTPVKQCCRQGEAPRCSFEIG